MSKKSALNHDIYVLFIILSCPDFCNSWILCKECPNLGESMTYADRSFRHFRCYNYQSGEIPDRSKCGKIFMSHDMNDIDKVEYVEQNVDHIEATGRCVVIDGEKECFTFNNDWYVYVR